MFPLLQSCSFGYHAGGWGKPPVDETGKPLYGDVFGTNAAEFQVWVDCLVWFYSVKKVSSSWCRTSLSGSRVWRFSSLKRGVCS